MSSTRESSPAVESNPSSPTQLTPRSKVKALLARLDDSDDESVSASPRKRVAAALAKPSRKSKSPTPTGSLEEALTNTNASKPDDTTDDDEEEDIVRPKGRLAARMHANLHGLEDVENSGNAIERVRKLLATKSKSPEPTADSEKAASDDSDAPVIPRKRKIRTTRRETPQSSPEKRQPSPGLFVSPSKEKAASNSAIDDSDSDSDLPAVDDNRFKALVQKKREERLAREAEAAKEKARKLADRRQMEQQLENDDDIFSDDDAERRLTQPTRKAGKKAAEEIRRETQRMSRNQQLAHKPVTKKKYAKADFLAKFNMGPKKEASDPILPTSSSSPAPQSDVEMKETPPTSPASIDGDAEKSTESILPEPVQDVQDVDEDMPTLEGVSSRIPSSPPTRLDKGKGREVRESTAEPETKKKRVFAQRPIRVRVPKSDKKAIALDESDSDLEIISAKTADKQRRKIDSIFDRIPARQAKESHSIHALRMLAQVKSPGKPTGKNKKPSMTTGELQMSLQQKARQQAAREREERLQELRDKGIIVQTAEEREKEMAEVEDLIAKARREGEEIMKREKAASKEERKANGEVDPLEENSSDDEDWEEEKAPDAEAELSLSGSEDENEDPENSDGDASGEEEEGDDEPAANPMFDNEASESDPEEEEADLTIPEPAQEADVDEDDLEQAPVVVSRRNKQRVVSDDEDEESHDESYSVPQTQSPKVNLGSPTAPTSVLRSATKTFIPGVTVAGPAGLGLTQIFAGTMDESQAGDDKSQTASNLMSPPKNNHPGLAFLRNIPAPELPDFIPTMEEDTQDQDIIMNSQPEGGAETQNFDSMPGIQLDFSQSQFHEFDSLVQDSQTPFPEATQDLGYQHVTPIRGRFVEAPPSTVDTVMLDPSALPETLMETPIVKKKGKLRQRNRITSFSDEEDVDEPVSKAAEEDDYEINANIFDVMRKARKKTAVVDEFDKKNSKAKDMVHEQADESEDEYAGLGGASDDESGGEADAFVKEMIDDDSKQHVDEGKLSAFFAERERARDEKEVEKLYKDVTNGMLRRKRGADYDLSDSDDGGEAQKRRKRAKFAKMQKALLADERIGKIAENPKGQAFLRAIEDRGSGDEIDFLDDFAEVESTDSQSQSQDASQQIVSESQPTEMGPPQSKSDAGARLPSNLRRTKPSKKPANLSEIRESLSSLIEEPNSLISAHPESESDDELEIEGAPPSKKEKENRDPFALRRGQATIVDRISLKRQSSSSLSANTKLAFSTSSGGASSFKVPALLRRATTNNSLASTSSSVGGTERMGAGSGSGAGGDGVKRGGSRNSGVTGNYVAREAERRAGVLEAERRREKRLVKGAEGRRKAVGGLFGGGKFE